MEGRPPPGNIGSSSRGRKRKSVDTSPTETEPREPPEPERKLKRPRTRLNVETGAEPSTAAAARRNTVINNTSPPNGVNNGGDPSTAPGFLQSLLQEVEVDPFAEHEKEIAAPQPKRVIIERACSPQVRRTHLALSSHP